MNGTLNSGSEIRLSFTVQLLASSQVLFLSQIFHWCLNNILEWLSTRTEKYCLPIWCHKSTQLFSSCSCSQNKTQNQNCSGERDNLLLCSLTSTNRSQVDISSTCLWIWWTHLLSVGWRELGHHKVMFCSRYHTRQLVLRTESSAVLQCLLPGLVLLDQDHIVWVADEGKTSRTALSPHHFALRGDGDTVAIGTWLTWSPFSIFRAPFGPLPCITFGTDVKSWSAVVR